MRRILFTTPLLVLSALAAAAGSSAAHHAVICPGEAGIGCCQPLAHCCAGIVPQQCPTLTIAASPDPSLEGKRVKISGQLFGTSSVSHVKIVLWEKLAKQHSFHRVASTRTNSGGHYSIVRRAGAVKTNRAWYVVANGLRSASACLAQTSCARSRSSCGWACARCGSTARGACSLSAMAVSSRTTGW